VIHLLQRMRRMPRSLPPALWAALAVSSPVQALDAQRGDVRAFVGEMVAEHGFEADELERVLAQAQSQPSIVNLISRPAEKSRPWHEYRAMFLTGRRIGRGVELADVHAEALARAETRGVPASVLLAITGVETFYGEIVGRHRVVDALATLAFDYPPRGPFFRDQLEQFLLMTREESLDPLDARGSYAGAMGIPQFMPSSVRAYAVDGDGDGRRDLWASWSDVFASIANYLALHGWRSGEPVMAPADVADADLAGLEFGKVALTETVGSLRERGVNFETSLPADAPAVLLSLTGLSGPEFRVGFANFYAITRYNRSQMYASAVSDLADAIAAATAVKPSKPVATVATAPVEPVP
jgi:membrane-bound lytic murein transglycosylase B